MKNLLFLLVAFAMSAMATSCENQNNQSSAQNKSIGTNIDCAHDLLAEYRCTCGGKLKHSFRAISYEKSAEIVEETVGLNESMHSVLYAEEMVITPFMRRDTFVHNVANDTENEYPYDYTVFHNSNTAHIRLFFFFCSFCSGKSL